MAHGIWLTDDTPLGYGPRNSPYPRGVSDCCGRMVVMVVMPKVIYRRSYIKVIFIKAIFIKARFIKARLEKDKDF